MPIRGMGDLGSGGGGGTHAKDLFTVVNASIKTYTLTDTPVTDSQLVMQNGQDLSEGVGEDYTVSGKDIILDAACVLFVGDKILVKYNK